MVLMPVLAAALSLRLARPVGQLNDAIGALGRGQWDTPVRTRGPRDLVLVGRRLEWLRKRLRGLEIQKTRFIQHVSHDLKTPLASLREGTSLLSEGVIGELTVAQHEVVEILQANGARLESMIEQLLAVADPASPRQLTREPVRLAELARKVIDDQTLQWLTRRIRIDVDGDPPEIALDRELTRIILDNLISNAIKHTPANGTITVDLAGGERSAQIDVRDSGPGIDRNERELIFEPFYTSSHDGSSTGTGLGLAIAREYARLHGGDLTLVEDGPGAHFRVALPAMSPTKATNA
jgi:two-component system sensor histidine kinase GlrK